MIEDIVVVHTGLDVSPKGLARPKQSRENDGLGRFLPYNCVSRTAWWRTMEMQSQTHVHTDTF